MEKILILHTGTSVSILADRILTEAGFNTYIAEDIESGINIAKIYLPDMIVLESEDTDDNASEIIKELQKDNNLRIKPLICISNNPNLKDLRKIMEAGADDYIAAPYSNPELVRAVTIRMNKYYALKLKCDELRNETIEGEGETPANKNHILVKIGTKLRLIKFENIVCVTAEKEYSKISIHDSKKYIIRKSLRKWIELLPDDNFLQIHRSTIINTEYIDRIEIQADKNYLVHLKTIQEPLAISQRFAKKITKKFYT